MSKQPHQSRSAAKKPIDKKNMKKIRGGGVANSDVTITKQVDKSSPGLNR